METTAPRSSSLLEINIEILKKKYSQYYIYIYFEVKKVIITKKVRLLRRNGMCIRGDFERKDQESRHPPQHGSGCSKPQSSISRLGGGQHKKTWRIDI